MLTLSVIRQTFINSYLGGKDKEDRKLQNNFIDAILIQTRAKIAETMQAQNTEWLQRLTFETEKVKEDTGYYYKTKTKLPQIINNRGLGLYLIRSDQKNLYSSENFEILDYAKFIESRHDRYTRNKTKVALFNGDLYIRAKHIGDKIDVYCILFDPRDEPNFSDKESRFPISGENVTDMFKLAIELYLEPEIKRATENENNSSEEQLLGEKSDKRRQG